MYTNKLFDAPSDLMLGFLFWGGRKFPLFVPNTLATKHFSRLAIA
jgi:hypothetical protein